MCNVFCRSPAPMTRKRTKIYFWNWYTNICSRVQPMWCAHNKQPKIEVICVNSMYNWPMFSILITLSTMVGRFWDGIVCSTKKIHFGEYWTLYKNTWHNKSLNTYQGAFSKAEIYTDHHTLVTTCDFHHDFDQNHCASRPLCLPPSNFRKHWG